MPFNVFSLNSLNCLHHNYTTCSNKTKKSRETAPIKESQCNCKISGGFFTPYVHYWTTVICLFQFRYLYEIYDSLYNCDLSQTTVRALYIITFWNCVQLA